LATGSSRDLGVRAFGLVYRSYGLEWLYISLIKSLILIAVKI